MDWMAPGPQFNDRRARFDAEIRRVLNTISGHWQSAWVTDHFQWGEDDCLEVMTSLAYYAAVFPHMDWGTIVACQAYRNPALMAKMASTIQYLTKGRLILGIGAGWKVDEHVAYNYDFPSAGMRVAQLEETVEIFKRMWNNDKSSYDGAHYKIKDAINLPRTPKAADAADRRRRRAEDAAADCPPRRLVEQRFAGRGLGAQGGHS